jgi:hypothetical protein
LSTEQRAYGAWQLQEAAESAPMNSNATPRDIR